MGDTLLLFITVPAVTALIGYVTNWTAVKMIFHPRNSMGVGPLAWQGIVYKLAPKFASEIAATTGQVLSPEDLVDRLDLPGLIARLRDSYPDEITAIIEETFEIIAPGIWLDMAPTAREQIEELLFTQIAGAGDVVITGLAERIDEVLDLDRIIVEELTGENADRLARVAEEIGERELRFIEWYGGVFGFGVGIIQAAAFSVLGRWWIMPIVGAVVGLGTNWLAIQMIFRPLEPRRYLGMVTYQGMFPKRQAEIAADYGRIAATEVLTPENLVNHVASSTRLSAVGADVRRELRQRVDEMGPMLAMFTGTEPNADQFDEVERVLMQRANDLLPVARPVIETHLGSSLGLESLIKERLASLDKLQFERMLRGIFEEDEIILILIGGVLGGAMGAAQGAIVLGAGW